MPEFSATDHVFMQRALQLAEQGRYSAHPNPKVGCVIVKDGEIIGEGWHEYAGGPHAEINALRAAGDQAAGATAYVTLEPCAHQGKTPPCCDALIAAGIGEVVVARQDPNPDVDGKGNRALVAAGITVRCGLLQQDADRLLAGFLSRMQRGRPYLRLKIACSLDGRTAMANGDSQWISGIESRQDVQRLRAQCGAVMTGIGTVLADDPSLTVRDASLHTRGMQPLRVVLDSRLRMAPGAAMLGVPGNTVVFCSDDSNAAALRSAGAEVIRVAGDTAAVDVPAVLAWLAQRQVNDLLVEAGPRLAGHLLDQGLVDELVIYQAPHIMGSETLGMFTTPGWTALADRQQLEIIETTRLGDDTRIRARCRN